MDVKLTDWALSTRHNTPGTFMPGNVVGVEQPRTPTGRLPRHTYDRVPKLCMSGLHFYSSRLMASIAAGNHVDPHYTTMMEIVPTGVIHFTPSKSVTNEMRVVGILPIPIYGNKAVFLACVNLFRRFMKCVNNGALYRSEHAAQKFGFKSVIYPEYYTEEHFKLLDQISDLSSRSYKKAFSSPTWLLPAGLSDLLNARVNLDRPRVRGGVIYLHGTVKSCISNCTTSGSKRNYEKAEYGIQFHKLLADAFCKPEGCVVAGYKKMPIDDVISSRRVMQDAVFTAEEENQCIVDWMTPRDRPKILPAAAELVVKG